MTTITKAFDPTNQKHVLWLKDLMKLTDVTKIPNPLEQERALKRANPEKLLQANPMGVKMTKEDFMQFPMTHFGLAMLYTNAVLSGEAWIPPE